MNIVGYQHFTWFKTKSPISVLTPQQAHILYRSHHLSFQPSRALRQSKSITLMIVTGIVPVVLTHTTTFLTAAHLSNLYFLFKFETLDHEVALQPRTPQCYIPVWLDCNIQSRAASFSPVILVFLQHWLSVSPKHPTDLYQDQILWLLQITSFRWLRICNAVIFLIVKPTKYFSRIYIVNIYLMFIDDNLARLEIFTRSDKNSWFVLIRSWDSEIAKRIKSYSE